LDQAPPSAQGQRRCNNNSHCTGANFTFGCLPLGSVLNIGDRDRTPVLNLNDWAARDHKGFSSSYNPSGSVRKLSQLGLLRHHTITSQVHQRDLLEHV